MTFSIPELTPLERGVLANVDELVELGIPRDQAEPAVSTAIGLLEATLEALDTIDQRFPSQPQRMLAKSLFVGGLFNWASEKAPMAAMILPMVISIYSKDSNNG